LATAIPSLRGRDCYDGRVHALCCSADMIQAAGRIAVTIGNDVIAPLLCEEFPLFRGELATTALQVEHQMIIEPTYCAGDNVRMR
jgi:hypothetical protein